MTKWHGMMLLVSEWSLKSPLHNATITRVLRVLAGSLFHKFGFFMDCLCTVIRITWHIWISMQTYSKKIADDALVSKFVDSISWGPLSILANRICCTGLKNSCIINHYMTVHCWMGAWTGGPYRKLRSVCESAKIQYIMSCWDWELTVHVFNRMAAQCI